MQNLTDKVAIVTGAHKGIGKAIADALSSYGCHVVRADLQGDDCFPCDVVQEEQLATLVTHTLNLHGRLDIVVNNAGGVKNSFKPALELTADDIREMMEFNAVSAFNLSRLSAPHLLKTQGTIINISSVVGRLSDRGFLGYGMAKAALSHMTRLLANEWAPRIRVNGVECGSVVTESFSEVVDTATQQVMAEATPLKRLGTPADIAQTVAFLSSSAASYMTGKIVSVDGGLEACVLKSLPDLTLPDEI